MLKAIISRFRGTLRDELASSHVPAQVVVNAERYLPKEKDTYPGLRYMLFQVFYDTSAEGGVAKRAALLRLEQDYIITGFDHWLTTVAGADLTGKVRIPAYTFKPGGAGGGWGPRNTMELAAAPRALALGREAPSVYVPKLSEVGVLIGADAADFHVYCALTMIPVDRYTIEMPERIPLAGEWDRTFATVPSAMTGGTVICQHDSYGRIPSTSRTGGVVS